MKLLKRLLEKDLFSETHSITPNKYLNVFENLDEIVKVNNNKQIKAVVDFIEFCWKNFASINEGRKETAHFMIITVCYLLKEFKKNLRQFSETFDETDFTEIVHSDSIKTGTLIRTTIRPSHRIRPDQKNITRTSCCKVFDY